MNNQIHTLQTVRTTSVGLVTPSPPSVWPAGGVAETITQTNKN